MMTTDHLSSSERPTIANSVKPMQPKRNSFSVTASTSSSSSSTKNNTSFLMKFLPHRKRMSEEVKRTSIVLDDYANLLSRDSNFLAAGGDAATVSSATASLNESVHTSGTHRPSVVSMASVGSFQRQEVALGALLGKGHFSKVYEITSIDLDDSKNSSESTGEFDGSEHARLAMSKNAKAGKYAMKRLRKKLTRRPRDFTRAAAHLVIEAQYLSKLEHPNIVKLRGSALGGASSYEHGHHDGYFLIIDRVTETLSERIHSNWAERRASGSLDEAELLFQKTHYALQLASAVHYLHDRRIIFRDMSPRNMGFTDDHSLQLFDFGMARDLPQALGLSNELFHMTLNAGSKPYAAVEVATTGLYNLKADVFSWSMVVYEMMMEHLPYVHLAGKGKKAFAHKEFVQAVYIDGERPSFEGEELLAPAPPASMQQLLAKCWQEDLFRRPTMAEVFVLLEVILRSVPHKSKSLQLGMTPPGPAKVTDMVLETQEGQSLSLSDLSNGVDC